MKITNIEIIPIRPNQGHVAFCSFIYDNSIAIKGVAIYTKFDGGIRLVYPTKRNSSCPELSIHLVYPINKESYDAIAHEIYEEYSKVMIKPYKH